MAPAEDKNKYGDEVDSETFDQILEMDDDDPDRDFSQGIVFDFFSQADTTFESMDEALDKKNLAQLSDLGHFLKGSSATLGFTNVKDACEKIQNVGKMLDETGVEERDDKDQALDLIRKYKEEARIHIGKAEKQMLAFYQLDERP